MSGQKIVDPKDCPWEPWKCLSLNGLCTNPVEVRFAYLPWYLGALIAQGDRPNPWWGTCVPCADEWRKDAGWLGRPRWREVTVEESVVLEVLRS